MANLGKNNPAHTPSSTYRLQLHRGFTFDQADGIVDYLAALGIGDCYLSPFLKAAPGSLHGYDITDPRESNPEIGSVEDLRRLKDHLIRRGMGIIADIVPNHMCIDDPANEWWWDVLENGPSSPFARYFDIDWYPLKEHLRKKVLLPILGDQYGRILEDQQIQVDYDRGALRATVYGKPLPLAPRSWGLVLGPAADDLKHRLGENHEYVQELESILTGLSHLAPADEQNPDRIRERQREKEVLRKRIAALTETSRDARCAIEAARVRINGQKGCPRSFDRLEELLAQQSYRLSFWKVASDEINYRRFFDINKLAAIHIEDPEVFQSVHAFMLDLIGQGLIDGLRVDHSDGLWDPADYFRRLQSACSPAAGSGRSFYIVTEKILIGNEVLRGDWEIAGTTGYEFLGLVNGLFIDRRGRRAFARLYEAFTRTVPACEDLVYDCKKLTLQTSMSGELSVLAGKLDKISEQYRWSRDFTFASLRHVLRETVACFPIYRTYITYRADRPDPEDERHIREAIGRAKRRNQSTDESLFDFLQKVLLLEDPEGIDDRQRAARREFIMSLQQFTGPVMAKGLEDTAFYRYFPLSSLNEVGSDPSQFGTAPSTFHAANQQRLQLWPHGLLATSTHDSKRSEDARARINVLSEIPSQWASAIRSWRNLNRGHKTRLGANDAPSPDVEYLFYQTLAGIWPFQEPSGKEIEELLARLKTYMQKALREGKVHSSWINPNQAYEEAVEKFVSGALTEPGNVFISQVSEFVAAIQAAGIWNSLSQTLIKICSPGVPDFYQGTELWDFSLVDPDNRRPVDYAIRRELLGRLRKMEEEGNEGMIRELSRHAEDGLLKMFVISRGLCFRKTNQELLTGGAYWPLRGAGKRQNHLISFARTGRGHSAISVCGRFFMGLNADRHAPIGEETWGDSVLLLRHDLEHRYYRDILSHRIVAPEMRNGQRVLRLAEVFEDLPLALLEGL